MKPDEIIKLVLSIIVCQLAGVIGSVFTTPSIPHWYAALRKPSFTPPNWLFSPVWITLFVLLGLSAFLVWRKGLDFPRVKTALIIFCVQLLFNISWSVAFFGFKSPLLGFIVIVMLWFAIIWTILSFFKISNWAGGLLLPYLLWVSFASILNFSIWRLNP